MLKYVTDMRTGAEDRIPITDPADWNARLNVVNGSPLAKPYPRDREFWAVTEDGEAVEVRYDEDASRWLSSRGETPLYFSRQDGEPGTFGADELVGWTDDAEDAAEAAALFCA